jgi:phage terminase small subunit
MRNPNSAEGLSDKQQRFADEYLIDGNATQAGIRAGYSPNGVEATASKLLRNPKVSLYLDKRRAALAKKHEITLDKIISELALIGFARLDQYVRITPDGDPTVDLSKMTSEQSAAITEITIDEYMDGRGDDAREVKKVRIKLGEKRAALVDLGKHFGLGKDNGDEDGKMVVVVRGGLPDPEPVEEDEVVEAGKIAPSVKTEEGPV